MMDGIFNSLVASFFAALCGVAVIFAVIGFIVGALVF